MNYRNVAFALLVMGALAAYKIHDVDFDHHEYSTLNHQTISEIVESVTHDVEVNSNVVVASASNFDFDFDFDFDPDVIFVDAGQDRDVVLERTFDVNAGELLNVDIEHSNLIIETGSDNRVHVRVEVESDNMDRAMEFYESLNFSVEELRGGVEISADRRRNQNWNWNRSGRFKITTFVVTPKEFDYEIKVSHGNAELDPINGSANIQMSHGNLNTGTIRGSSTRINMSHGNYKADGLISDNVEVRSSHGNVDIDSIESEEVEANLSHGNIQVGSVSGSIRMSNSHGNIDVGVGDFENAHFSNSHGNVTIFTKRGSSADVDLRGERVRLSSDMSFDGDLKKTEAEGSINGGGPNIVARTSHGSISLKNR